VNTPDHQCMLCIPCLTWYQSILLNKELTIHQLNKVFCSLYVPQKPITKPPSQIFLHTYQFTCCSTPTTCNLVIVKNYLDCVRLQLFLWDILTYFLCENYWKLEILFQHPQSARVLVFWGCFLMLHNQCCYPWEVALGFKASLTTNIENFKPINTKKGKERKVIRVRSSCKSMCECTSCYEIGIYKRQELINKKCSPACENERKHGSLGWLTLFPGHCKVCAWTLPPTVNLYHQHTPTPHQRTKTHWTVPPLSIVGHCTVFFP